MTLKELANELAERTAASLAAEGATIEVTPILTKKELATHGREMDTGNIALRVFIEINADLPAELGSMELFPTVSKKQLKRDIDSVLASVVRLVASATQYRSEMIGRALARMETAV